MTKERYSKHLRKTLLVCNSQGGYSILRYLNRFGNTSYSNLGKILFGKDNNGKYSLCAYYVRIMKKFGVIELKNQNYYLTTRGKRILKFLENMNEKFITDQPESLCLNSMDCQHEMITFCRKCSYIEKKEPEPMELLISKKIRQAEK